MAYLALLIRTESIVTIFQSLYNESESSCCQLSARAMPSRAQKGMRAMAVLSLPVDQRVIDIDSRRFASIEKALVELVTNVDDSYARLERTENAVSGAIRITYERHQNGAVLTVGDQAEGMALARICAVLSYGGAHSLLAHGEASGRGYFGRGLKQAIYGLGYK